MPALVTDELWAEVQPLLPRYKPSPKGGAPRTTNDRACLEGILYVLRGGIAWSLLPAGEYPSYATCWRRLRDWTAAGVWDALHQRLLQRLEDAAAIDWSRGVIDSAVVRAVKGGPTPARTRPTAASRGSSGVRWPTARG
jgi:transposase